MGTCYRNTKFPPMDGTHELVVLATTVSIDTGSSILSCDSGNVWVLQELVEAPQGA